MALGHWFDRAARAMADVSSGSAVSRRGLLGLAAGGSLAALELGRAAPAIGSGPALAGTGSYCYRDSADGASHELHRHKNRGDVAALVLLGPYGMLTYLGDQITKRR